MRILGSFGGGEDGPFRSHLNERDGKGEVCEIREDQTARKERADGHNLGTRYVSL